MAERSKAVLRVSIAATSIPGHVSGWCGHGLESHLQPFLLTYPGLIKAYNALSSLFNNQIYLSIFPCMA